MFLKQIRARGFKSFADLTVLDFTHEMIGVVGPNGSGKSNITDAIRWALGEQSAKSLRGGNLEDIVFSGSANRSGVESAEVTLVFDNQQQTFLNLPQNTVEITRRFNKKTRESDFFLNKERVRLRDIQDLALEAGLTKSSIAIISQGTISQFAQAKPEQRREIFDDAAGVGKYKKRKRETQAKLLKTMENYQRLEDLQREIGRRLPNLERQAQKAQLVKTKKDELAEYEVSILTLDVQNYTKRLKVLIKEIAQLENQVHTDNENLTLAEEELTMLLQETTQGGKTINELHQDFQNILSKLHDLQTQKIAAENRETSTFKNANLDHFRAQEIQKNFEALKITLQTEKDHCDQWKKLLDEKRARYDFFTSKYQQVFEEIKILRQQQAKLEVQKENLQTQIINGTNRGSGYQLILQNKQNFPGIIGTLLELITVPEVYQVAISAVIGPHIHSLVTNQISSVKAAIEFLKKNQGGRATFLPLDTLQPNPIVGTMAQAIEQEPGFIGFGHQIVKIQTAYQRALDYALGNIIVIKNYENALKLAKVINYRFNIVTLEGERILPRGAIIGGKDRRDNLFMQTPTVTHSLTNLQTALDQLIDQESNKTRELNDYKSHRDDLRDEIVDYQGKINHGTVQISNWEKQLANYSQDYRLLTGKPLFIENETKKTPQELESVKLIREIVHKERERDEIQEQINRLTNAKNKHSKRQQDLNLIIREQRKNLDFKKTNLANIQQEKNFLEIKKNSHLEILAESYGLTLETVLAQEVPVFNDEDEVRLRIKKLITEIKELGNVNYEAIEEYKNEKERFDFYQTQFEEILAAVQHLEKVIKEIDQAMISQFQQIINDVNQVLPEVFQKLFGGGEAILKYTEPDNLLETGIDIRVNPPGKKITNINLLSGGEKSLVALSVLFAILKVRPLPLVILDEAEAPLDPANVERFARYVRQFTTESQFIIVTHREGTMENCDVLFGVTMEIQGITKMVKIHLLEAKQLASPVAQTIEVS